MEVENLKKRIEYLENQVEYLRVSRRVLMNLLEKTEKEKRLLSIKYESENKKLHKDNLKYVYWLWDKNKRILELESRKKSY
ncbi:hypothetical protein SAMN00017405_1485 [Desulfonispora thiosulfatigenes DSM 11270]|uniref:Translation initiation factor 2 n=1 Tax=Desulfonispora thiosulfatigenes DSM 11270 TaxID=656914 RepID=A0A1W1VTN7_DESTI|nr:hypothetical protein [Desulfonispora thiosulfatigenes]SMB96254.1 hypothetical protein SAMN00017405_1485 [Desulfonispora thiosulfatigenes DSM 11270]